MMVHMKPSSGAHVGAKASVSHIMWQVMLAISPATAFGILCFGWPALNLFIITVLSAVFFEVFCLRLSGRMAKPVIMDGSAVLTGWLLAMTLPPWAPWWIGVAGSGLAIVLGKQVYGGLGQNLFNPAMLARVALLISFPIEMTTWPNVSPLFFSHSPGLFESWHITFAGLENLDATTGATTLGLSKLSSRKTMCYPRYERLFRVSEFHRLDTRQPGETSTLLLGLAVCG